MPRDVFVSPCDDGKGETRRLFAAPTSPGNSSGGEYCPMAPSPVRKACLFGPATDRIPPPLIDPEPPGDYCLMTVNPCLAEGVARLQPMVIGGRAEPASKCDGAATTATSIDNSRTIRTVAAQSPTDAYCDMSSKSAGAASPSGLGANLQVRSADEHRKSLQLENPTFRLYILQLKLAEELTYPIIGLTKKYMYLYAKTDMVVMQVPRIVTSSSLQDFQVQIRSVLDCIT